MGVSICFVSLNNYAVLSGDPSVFHIGGAEVQQMHIAHGLAKRGHKVSFVTLDHGQPDGVEIDGIRVFKAYGPTAGIQRLRFLHPRWTGLCGAMRRADAQVYYQRTAASESGQVCWWCRRNRRPFIFSLASDNDCDPRLPALSSRMEKGLYRYALRHADLIVSQTKKQQSALKQWLGRDSVVIPSCRPVADSAVQALRPSRPVGRPRILWVGRLIECKRAELCLDLAQRCPEVLFDIVGDPNAKSSYARAIRERSKQLPNVTMHGSIPYRLMDEMYRQSAILLCTSSTEGFPNTFLEAWSRARPVVSTFDPDGLIAERGLGVAAVDVPGLIAGLRGLLASPERWHQASRNAYRYCMENHTVDAVMPRLERIFHDPLVTNASRDRVP